MESPSLRTVIRNGARLLRLTLPRHPWGFAIAVSGALLFVSSIVASALVIGWVTDRLIIPVLDQGRPVDGALTASVLAIVGVAVWRAVGITIRRTAAGWVNLRTVAETRSELVAHQYRMSMPWLASRTTGRLLAVTENDVRASFHFLNPLPYATGALFLLVGSAAIITWLDPVLGALVIVFIVLVVAIAQWAGWVLNRLFERVQRRREEVTATAHESIDGALTVKALGREDLEVARFEAASQRLRDALIDVTRVWTRFRALVDGLPPLAIVTALVVGAARIEAGALTTGELVSVVYLLSLVGWPVKLIGFAIEEIAAGSVAWERVEEVLRAEDVVRYGTAGAITDDGGAEVAGRDVGFGYDERPVLDGVALDIPPGRIVAIVGATGSGKSTLAMLLARMWDPRDGAIHLDGRDLRALEPGALRQEIAYVPQETFLFEDTVRANIALGTEATDGEIRAAAELAGAAGFIAELPDGYDTVIGERGATLSGGQRQRIALARALVRRPRLLVVDDATSAVDPSVEAAILRNLRKAELPSTVVLVAYRPSAIATADEVLFVSGGRIVAHGSHADLMAKVPEYAALVTAYEQDARQRGMAREGSP